MPLRSLNKSAVAFLLCFTFLVLFFSGFLEFPYLSSPIIAASDYNYTLFFPDSKPDPFTDLLGAFRKWDAQVGCSRFREKHEATLKNQSTPSSLQDAEADLVCSDLKLNHVNVLVKGWTWIPDNLDNLYTCRCGLSCLWTKSSLLADNPDAMLFETTTPPFKRRRGDPLRVYMDLEPGRKKSGFEDIFISYHADDDVQSTYAGGLFHNNRNYQLSLSKNRDKLVYWSSSRCVTRRNSIARTLFKLIPYHSFGKCLNNVGGSNKALTLYPECIKDRGASPKWWDHLHCSMSHYKFVLGIENTITDSYVTEKLFYALDSGAVPIYFGAKNVWDFLPPNSIIDGNKFKSMEDLASYVKALADNPVAYAEYHAWRRCGVLGNYRKARAASLDSLPCRLCEEVSRRNGRAAKP